MSIAEIIVSIVAGLGCLALGVFLGAMPFRRKEITEAQYKYQQLGGVLACGVVVILILLGMDVASWIVIGALAVGAACSRIPAVHRWLLARFPMLHPAEPTSPLKRAKRK